MTHSDRTSARARRFRPGFALAVSALVAGLAPAAAGADPALWLRTPAISPDGSTIAFSYRGDLWTVPAAGGVATPLTVDPGYETAPVWSPDGRTIAYAADRYGDLDVFAVPAAGGTPVRLTAHSADERPTSFTPDGREVLFSAARLDDRRSAQFPTGAQPELYAVAVAAPAPGEPLRRPRRVLTTPAEDAVWDGAGARLAYTDRKAYEMEWRKHDTSSFTRDVWIYDRASGRHTRLTGAGVDDRQPVWSPDGKALYLLSERSGSFNVWKLDLAQALAAGGGEAAAPALTQVTRHATHPVRFLSASKKGDLCYTWDGEIWTLPAGAAEPRKLTVTAATAPRVAGADWFDVSSDVHELELSPDGKEIAFIARGEVFVTSADHQATRRITSTPEQERTVTFSPDGRSLFYAGERGGRWKLYRSDLTDTDEPNFFNATAIVEKPVLAVDAEVYQPKVSPDGKQVAYLENRTTLKVLDLATGATRVVLAGDRNYSYTDDDQWFEWSPDGQWLLAQMLSPGRWSNELGLVPASGKGEVVNLTRSGYEDSRGRWNAKGDTIYWITDRKGMRSQGGWGSQGDVYAMFLTQEAWDRFHLSDAEYEQVKAKEDRAEKAKKAKEAKEGAAKGDKKGGKTPGTPPEELDSDLPKPKLADRVDFDLDRREDRVERLTRASSDVADARMTPDGEKLVVLAKYEKGYDVWLVEPRKEDAKLLAKLDAKEASGLAISQDAKKAFLLEDGKLVWVDMDSGKVNPVKLDGAAMHMELDRAAERAYLFEHIWRQTKEKFYVPTMHGVDWDAMKTAYAKFLPHIENGRDFAELVSEMQGELDASHTGGRYRPKPGDGDDTASLGFFPDDDYAGAGILVAELLPGSPLAEAKAGIEAGTVIESIDGQAIAPGAEWAPLLDHKAGVATRLALYDPAKKRRWQAVVKPIARREEGELLYERWVRSRRDEVERLSGGRIGYAHIRGMNDASYRLVFDEVFGRAVGKEAIVLDTRWNGGGNLVETLTTFLTGQPYAQNVSRGQKVGSEPSMRWTRPSIVVMNEGNYSDAHCFPAAYTDLHIGETVGMPVAGTCTSVWWEKLQDPNLVFGIPQVGLVDPAGDYLENKHLAPDHQVDNDPALEATGRDQQLETAVEVLLAKLGPKQDAPAAPAAAAKP